MNDYIIIGFLSGALFFTMYFLFVRNKSKRENLRTFQSEMNLSDSELIEKFKLLLASGKKIEAVKLVASRRKSGLVESKNLVERIENGISENYVFEPLKQKQETKIGNDELETIVRKFLSDKRKLEAIKFVSVTKNLGLKEAKDYVESLE